MQPPTNKPGNAETGPPTLETLKKQLAPCFTLIHCWLSRSWKRWTSLWEIVCCSLFLFVFDSAFQINKYIWRMLGREEEEILILILYKLGRMQWWSHVALGSSWMGKFCIIDGLLLRCANLSRNFTSLFSLRKMCMTENFSVSSSLRNLLPSTWEINNPTHNISFL